MPPSGRGGRITRRWGAWLQPNVAPTCRDGVLAGELPPRRPEAGTSHMKSRAPPPRWTLIARIPNLEGISFFHFLGTVPGITVIGQQHQRFARYGARGQDSLPQSSNAFVARKKENGTTVEQPRGPRGPRLPMLSLTLAPRPLGSLSHLLPTAATESSGPMERNLAILQNLHRRTPRTQTALRRPPTDKGQEMAGAPGVFRQPGIVSDPTTTPALLISSQGVPRPAFLSCWDSCARTAVHCRVAAPQLPRRHPGPGPGPEPGIP